MAAPPSRALTGELVATREALLRIEGVKSTPEASYSLASISLAAASIVSPVFLVGGVQQAFSAYRQNQQSRVRLDELATETVRRVLDKWNYWIETLLPAFSHQIVESLFAMRGELAHHVADAGSNADPAERASIVTAIIERLARLETFLAYPEDPSHKHSRGDIVKAIKAVRERVQYPGFQTI